MRNQHLIIMIILIGPVHAAEITVSPSDEDYHQIQQAINNASAGDMILVSSGIYNERIHILKKGLILLGVNTGNGLPVINANGSGSAITLIANGSTVSDFNITGSGHCGCGNSGILVISGNNTIFDNILFKNKYGIYVRPGCVNNTFISNDFQDNEIATYDLGKNQWNSSKQGNHYSDYDEPEEGCYDNNYDEICDLPKNISGGLLVDLYPLKRFRN